MKIYNKFAALACAGIMLANTACVGDLDVMPDDPQTKLELTTTDEWYGYLGSLYGALLYEGNISWPGYGAGDGVYMRCHWNAQELTADGAVIMNKWEDPGYHALFENTWLDNNGWLYLCYAREADLARKASSFIIDLEKAGNLLTDAEKKAFAAEAHVLRGLAYYHMIDMFGRGPWVDENSTMGAIPPTYDRKQLFDAITAELSAAIPDVPVAAEQAYGRVSREAAYMLLAKLYLGAEVYTGTPMYAECAEACKHVLASGIQLAEEYKYLFCATNDKYNRGGGELLWVAPQEVGVMESWGGTTYLTAAAYCDAMPKDVLAQFGCGFTPWSGLKVRPELYNAFEPGDKRALFYTEGFTNSVEDLDSYTTEGYVCCKYTYTAETNYTNDPDKQPVIMSTGGMNDADYPVFRLADTYLMLAECEKRGVSGLDGLGYLNKVRDRAGLAPLGSYTLDDVLHERQCELYWEGFRRSDLIRFGLYTGGSYVWSWKGGIYAGASIPDYRAVFAIPYSYISAVGQNPGY
ncbi:MAG: RagB/SusD family nutrient uptake outer membrane protein [Muribaculaceae bacterium]|nr:RagB/SusD family nutrient uptake outer membrane protein [Muribaculaceae bacterium]